ncbi:hypothetical protein MRX96_030508 [Rhipicephalus microplus]
MPKSTLKFTTKHRSGGRTKKRKVYNFQKKRQPPSEDVDSPPVPSGHEEAVDNTECGLGLACQSGSDSKDVQPTFRCDTIMLKPAQLLMIKKNAEKKNAEKSCSTLHQRQLPSENEICSLVQTTPRMTLGLTHK